MAERPDVTGMGMVAVYPTPEEAAAIALADGNPADTMHCTLVFLGDVAELDMGAVNRAIASVAAETPALSGKIGGVGVFAAGDDGYPQFAIPNVYGLSTLRTRIVDALAAEGIQSPSEHDWVPHMTLNYLEEPSMADMSVVGSPLSFGHLTVTVEDVRTDHPLGSAPAPEEAAVKEPPQLSRSQKRKFNTLLLQAKELMDG